MSADTLHFSLAVNVIFVVAILAFAFGLAIGMFFCGTWLRTTYPIPDEDEEAALLTEDNTPTVIVSQHQDEQKRASVTINQGGGGFNTESPSIASIAPSPSERIRHDAAEAAKLSKLEGMANDLTNAAAVNVEPEEANELSTRGAAYFVDTRLDTEMNVSMLPNSIAYKDFVKQLAEGDVNTDVTIVCYCTIGKRSSDFAAKLAETHPEIADVRNLRGGILKWTHTGLPLQTRDGDPTREVHTYGHEWDLAAGGYHADYFTKASRVWADAQYKRDWMGL